jgi:hypothetical protein
MIYQAGSLFQCVTAAVLFCLGVVALCATDRGYAGNWPPSGMFLLARSLQKVMVKLKNGESTRGFKVDKSKVIDRRHIRLEEVMKPDYIPFMGGRPERSTVISADDTLNLVILLNTTTTAEAFINKL